MKKEELIIGKTYRVKSDKWFKQNKIRDFSIVIDGATFHNSELCGKIVTLDDFCDRLYNHEKDVEVRTENRRDYYIPPFALEPNPLDKRKPSKEILEAIEKLKEEKFIYGYDAGPGGGSGETIKTQKVTIAPAFNRQGEEGVYLKVSGLKRIFTLKKIQELFEKGKTEQSFKATEWTTITTSLELIENKKKLPKEHSWSTMRD
jgi:hypothetical protein